MEKKEFNFIDYLFILVKRRKLIIVNFFIVTILTAAYSLIMPKTFTASTVVLPPAGGSSLFSSLTANLPIGGLLGGLAGASDETNILIAILKSRSIAENTIKQFNLLERYESDDMEEAIIAFRGTVDVSINDEGMIVIIASSTTGHLADDAEENEVRTLCADIANFMVAELNQINTELQTKQAKFNRIFIERRYEQNKSDLRDAESAIKKFGETYGMISLPDQVSAAIQAAAQIESQIAVKEVELQALKSTLYSGHPEIKKKAIELREMHKKLEEMKLGAPQRDSLAIFPVFSEVPELGIKYLQLRRELEVQNKIFEFLTQQYEQAKIQEARDTPTVQVLDPAIPPIKRAKPKRAILVLLAGMVSIIFSALYIFSIEYLNRLKEDDEKKYRKLRSVLRGINIFKKQ
jgi:uncharacterized protein involved in exopolysaccharide biosynthesis